MKTVEQIIAKIIEDEGERYTNDPRDAGGPTKYGITQMTLASWRGKPVTPEDVRLMQKPEAELIYRHMYFIEPGFSKLFPESKAIAAELMDTGVNMGPGVAAKMLQRALNVFNNGGQLYKDIAVDGKIGEATVAALRAYIGRRGATGEAVMLRALNALQGTRYIEIAEGRTGNEAFIFGWFLNRVEM